MPGCRADQKSDYRNALCPFLHPFPNYRLLGEWGANIIEVHHQRTFTTLPLQTTEVEFVLQTRGLSHWKEILRELYRANYSVRLLDKDPDKAETKSTINPIFTK